MKAAPRHVRPLWLALFAGPAGLAVTLQGAYALAPAACVSGNMYPLHLMALTGLGIALIGTAVAWRGWQAAGGGGPMDPADPKLARARFLSLLGLLSGLLFSTTIVAHWLAIAFLDPCDSP
jgi:hypothetical protein